MMIGGIDSYQEGVFMRKVIVLGAILGLMATSGCSGMRRTGDTFVAHAESFRILGMELPKDDQQAALDQVPPGANITNVSSSAADWTSFVGVLGNIIGIHSTQIGGTVK